MCLEVEGGYRRWIGSPPRLSLSMLVKADALETVV